MDPSSTPMADLPGCVQSLFWEYDATALTWEADRDLIIRRVLTAGNWDAVTWLRDRLGDAGLRTWIERHRGGGLSPRQLRFWELVLDLSPGDVTAWIETARTSAWEARTSP